MMASNAGDFLCCAFFFLFYETIFDREVQYTVMCQLSTIHSYVDQDQVTGSRQVLQD